MNDHITITLQHTHEGPSLTCMIVLLGITALATFGCFHMRIRPTRAARRTVLTIITGFLFIASLIGLVFNLRNQTVGLDRIMPNENITTAVEQHMPGWSVTNPDGFIRPVGTQSVEQIVVAHGDERRACTLTPDHEINRDDTTATGTLTCVPVLTH